MSSPRNRFSTAPHETRRPLGYAALVERFKLPDLGLSHKSYLHTGSTLRKTQEPDGSLSLGYPRRYDPGATTLNHLVFALKHEGVDLRVLRAVLAAMPTQELLEGIRAQPTGQYLRRLWFLFEWFFEKELAVPDLTQGNYVTLLDPERNIVGVASNSRRHRISANTLGSAVFCPVLRRTPSIARCSAETSVLDARAQHFIRDVPAATLWRATNWLYDVETRSSYAIEHESHTPQRAERFVHVLRKAWHAEPMSRALLVRVQNSIVTASLAEMSERRNQNWVQRTISVGFDSEVRLIPPTPDALPGLLDAWIVLANTLTDVHSDVPPIIAAAVLSFAFVYLHPFNDGNGRTHRWLVH